MKKMTMIFEDSLKLLHIASWKGVLQHLPFRPLYFGRGVNNKISGGNGSNQGRPHAMEFNHFRTPFFIELHCSACWEFINLTKHHQSH